MPFPGPFPAPSNRWPALSPYGFAFAWMSHRENHAICSLLSLASCTDYNAFEVHPMLLHQSFAPYPWVVFYYTIWLFTTCLYISQLRDIWIVYRLWLLQKKNCSKYYCTEFCVNLTLHFSEVTRWALADSYGKCIVNLISKCFPRWRYHFCILTRKVKEFQLCPGR